MRIVSIHQPSYLPYLGFFDKIKKSDVFVLLDIVQFSRSEFYHRNKIRTKGGWLWLTIPVKRMFGAKINEIKIANQNWQKNHWKSIVTNYSKAPFWDKYSAELSKFYENSYEKLVDVTIPMICWFRDSLGISSKIILASELDLDESLTSTDLIIEIIEKTDCKTYLSGSMGKDYLGEDKFEENGIKLVYQKFGHPIYRQVYPGFIENMSALDFMLNNNKNLNSLSK